LNPTPNIAKDDALKTVVVTPYFEDIAAEQFCKELGVNLGKNDRVVIVDDGSTRHPFVENNLKDASLRGKIVRLKRNVGHQPAITTGVNYCVENMQFDRLVIMDSDGEDRPQDIQVLLNKLSDENVDIVVATRKSRQETMRFKAFYFIYQHLFLLLVGEKIGFGNFMALNKNAAKRLVSSYESQIHLAASVLKSKLQVFYQPIDRGARLAGNSKMNLVSLTLHGLRSIIVFAEQAMVRITLFCAAFAVVIIAAMVAIIIFKITGLAIPGWFSTGGGILLLLLFQVAMMTLLLLLSVGNMGLKTVEKTEYSQLIDAVIDVD